jgi:hypothetical protein
MIIVNESAQQSQVISFELCKEQQNSQKQELP